MKVVILLLVLTMLITCGVACNDASVDTNHGSDTSDAVTTVTGNNVVPNETSSETTHLDTTAMTPEDTSPNVNLDDFAYQILDDGTIEVSYKGKEEHVTVPEQIEGKTVTAIAEKGFSNAASFLKTVTLPDTIKTIGQVAFQDCTLLTSINFPKSLSQIGMGAFRNCTSLKNAEIVSDCLNENSTEAFYMSGLETITLGEEITYIPVYCFFSTKITQIKLPSKVIEIGDRAFAGCRLETVVLNEGLTTIGHKAFESNTSLKEIVIPKTVFKITEMAFSACSGLEKVCFDGNAPSTYEYSDFTGVWDPFNVNYTVYYHQGAEGFTSPTWYGYPTVVLP